MYVLLIIGSSSAVAAGSGQGRMPLGASREGRRKRGAVVFWPHEIYKNSVSSIEAEMRVEGQIMCIEQCTF